LTWPFQHITSRCGTVERTADHHLEVFTELEGRYSSIRLGRAESTCPKALGEEARMGSKNPKKVLKPGFKELGIEAD